PLTMGSSCLGFPPRDRGHSRVPDPPAIITPYCMLLVRCQLFVVSRRVTRTMANRLKVRIQARSQLIQNRAELLNLLACHKVAPYRTPQEVARLVERTPRYFHKSAVVLEASSTRAFGNIGADTV